MRDKTRKKIFREEGEQIKAMVKELLERLIREERTLYLAEHPTKANGHYTRDLLTLTGPVKDLKLPRVRERGFHLKILPYRRRTSLELSEAVLALYACGVSTGLSPDSLEEIYGAFYSPQSISRLTQVVEEEVQAWRERPLDEEHYAAFLDSTFLSIRRGKPLRSRYTSPWASSEMGAGRSWGFGCSGRKGKAPGTRRRYPRPYGAEG